VTTNTTGKLERTVSDQETSQHIKNLEVLGYSIAKSFLTEKTVSRLQALVDKYCLEAQSIQYKGRPARDVEDRMLYNLQNKDKFFIDILDLPFLRKIFMRFLNDPYYRFLPNDVPNYTMVYYNARTGGTQLDLHIDSHIPAPGDRTWSMQVGIVLNDHTLENGCTIVVPGSHKSGQFTDRELKNTQPILPKKGDVVFWDSRLWHGTMENKAQKPRWTLIATVTSWWLKPCMDIPRALPDEIYQELSKTQKVLMGFCSIPPKNEKLRINTKTGYEALLSSVKDYFD